MGIKWDGNPYGQFFPSYHLTRCKIITLSADFVVENSFFGWEARFEAAR